MNGIFRYARKTIFRLSVTMAICCALEVYFQLTEGTRSNYVFPWGHYRATIAVMGGLFVGIAFVTRGAGSPAPQDPGRNRSG